MHQAIFFIYSEDGAYVPRSWVLGGKSGILRLECPDSVFCVFARLNPLLPIMQIDSRPPKAFCMIVMYAAYVSL